MDLFKVAQEEGVTAEVYLYPGAGHTLEDEAWELAMGRTVSFFDRHVKGSDG